MSEVLIILTLMAPCLLAMAAAKYARSPIATYILVLGGLYFLLTIFLSSLFGQQCIGGLLEGFLECTPSLLTPLAQAMSSLLLVSFFGYLVVGPGLLIAAAIFEFLKRRAG